MMTMTNLSNSLFNVTASPRKKAVTPNAETEPKTTDAAINAKATEKPSPKQSKYPTTGDTFEGIKRYKDTKKIELDTPDGQHISIENSDKNKSTLRVCQGNGDTFLFVEEEKNNTEYTFRKQLGQNTFAFDSVSVPEGSADHPDLLAYKLNNGSSGVHDVIEVGDPSIPITIEYTHRTGMPVIQAPIYSFPSVAELGKTQMPKHLTLHQLTSADSKNPKAPTKTWEPSLEYWANPKLEAEKASKIEKTQAAMEQWYQETHPDDFYKVAQKLPMPTLKELVISFKVDPSN